MINVKECLSLETLEKCLASLTDTLKKTKIGKEFATYIKNSKNLLPGQQVPTFFVKDFKEIEYKSDTLHSNTKYTIIDFWASWCTPCRVQMKELKKIYSSLDTSKVQIISISIDTDKENWLKACKEEDILWKSYYDSGGWYGEVSKKFNLTYIPQNRIIGLSGKIVAFDLGMEELHSFLEGKNLLNN